MKFNERLKKYREEKGLTQAQLSELAGITTRQIQNYEGGKARPRLDAAEKSQRHLTSQQMNCLEMRICLLPKPLKNMVQEGQSKHNNLPMNSRDCLQAVIWLKKIWS